MVYDATVLQVTLEKNAVQVPPELTIHSTEIKNATVANCGIIIVGINKVLKSTMPRFVNYLQMVILWISVLS